jgi:hypothetical protein
MPNQLGHKDTQEIEDKIGELKKMSDLMVFNSKSEWRRIQNTICYLQAKIIKENHNNSIDVKVIEDNPT